MLVVGTKTTQIDVEIGDSEVKRLIEKADSNLLKLALLSRATQNLIQEAGLSGKATDVREIAPCIFYFVEDGFNHYTKEPFVKVIEKLSIEQAKTWIKINQNLRYFL